MNTPKMQQPILYIDLKKNQIRVHKVTLHLLGDPDCIQLLVNPKTGMLAIRGTIPEDHLGLKIHKEMLTDGNCYEIHSKNLMQKLCSVRSDLENNCSYRIYGKCDPKTGVAQFPMKDIVLIEDVLTNE